MLLVSAYNAFAAQDHKTGNDRVSHLIHIVGDISANGARNATESVSHEARGSNDNQISVASEGLTTIELASIARQEPVSLTPQETRIANTYPNQRKKHAELKKAFKDAEDNKDVIAYMQLENQMIHDRLSRIDDNLQLIHARSSNAGRIASATFYKFCALWLIGQFFVQFYKWYKFN